MSGQCHGVQASLGPLFSSLRDKGYPNSGVPNAVCVIFGIHIGGDSVRGKGDSNCEIVCRLQSGVYVLLISVCSGSSRTALATDRVDSVVSHFGGPVPWFEDLGGVVHKFD